MQNSAEFSWDSHSDDITDCEAQASAGASFLLTCIKTPRLTPFPSLVLTHALI